jgi:hypothetical protein
LHIESKCREYEYRFKELNDAYNDLEARRREQEIKAKELT